MKLRALLIIPIVGCFLVAIASGLLRLGWHIPLPNYDVLVAHGSLMVGGFLGALISLERAVALEKRVGFLVPLLAGISGFIQIFLPGWSTALWLVTAAAAGLCVLYILALRVQADMATAVQAVGAVAWLVASYTLAIRWPLYAVVPWWTIFVVFTIAGERLELSRYARREGEGRSTFLAASAILVVGAAFTAAATIFQRTAETHAGVDGDYTEGSLMILGTTIIAVGLLSLSAWLLRYDIARHSLRRPGITRYIAVCLLTGHIWLAVAGVIGVTHRGLIGGPPYDIILHGVYLGFVFSMIFGHALIILPALTGIQASFHRGLYVPLALLHVSIITRGYADLTGWYRVRNLSGMATGIALLLFFITIAASIYFARRANGERSAAA